MGRRFDNIQSNFNRGELSPRLIGRTDSTAYYASFKYAQNMRPLPQGAITKREGSVFVKEVKNSANTTIIFPFRFSTVQNYIIEFGDLYFRVYRNRSNIESSPGVPLEITTPWSSAILRELKFTQSYDALYVFHPSHQTRVITRTSDTAWSIGTLAYNDGPYLPINKTTTTLTPSGTSGSITFTASASVFVAGDVGRLIRIKQGTAWGNATITAFSSGTSVTATVNGTALGGTSATVDWRLGAFGGAQGWPSVGTIYEERLMVANTINNPSTIWGSETGGFSTTSVDMQPSKPSDGSVTDDNGFALTISDDEVNSIQWLSSGRVLLIGTSGAEHSMTGGSASSYAPITPTNVTVKRETRYGSKSTVKPRRIGNAVLYGTQSGRKMREMYYEFGVDSYLSRDVTVFSDHILQSGIIDMDYQQEPDTNLWCVRDDGQLIGFVYDKVQEIEGWHRHILGGTNAKVRSVACIPKPDRSGDDVWLVVSRTINGATKQYIEYLSDAFAPALNGNDSQFFVDSGITYNGYLAATLTPGATTGSGVTFTAGSSVFAAGDVGKQIRAGNGRAIITGYTSGTVVTANITTNFSSTATIPSGSWSLASKTFSGAGHLEGETCAILADGYVADDAVIASGSFTLEEFASKVHVGLSYTANIDLLPIEIKQVNTIQGKERRCHKVHIYVTNSLGLQVGSEDASLETIPTFKFGSLLSQAPALQNGIISRSPPAGYSIEGIMKINHIWPTNLTVNYVVQEIEYNGL